MHKLLLTLALLLLFSAADGQEKQPDRAKIREDLDEMLKDLAQNYVYLRDKSVDLDCIRQHYGRQIDNLKSEAETVLFFEYLLDEFYDSHLILNTNTKSSFRLYSPLYATWQNGKFIIASTWQSQIEPLAQNTIGAEIKQLNGIDFNQAIAAFPTHCHDKNAPKVREWLANKLLAGRYNQPRVLTLQLTTGKTSRFDLDAVRLKTSAQLLTAETRGNVGLIRLHNSLGNNQLVTAFDQALDQLMGTQALILDLRNTVDGGNSYVARGIMSRFVTEAQPYQRHEQPEAYDGQPPVTRRWVEYVTPRGRPTRGRCWCWWAAGRAAWAKGWP